MSNHDNLLGIFQTIYIWRKAIRNACLLALVGSVAICFLFLKDHFQATTIFYPASPDLASPELMFGNTGQVMNYFGSDRDLDRVAEIANSAELVDYMVDKFDLYAHYGQDSTSKKGQSKVREIFRGLYTATKNKNDAVEISVEDTDSKLSAEMANAAREKVNEIAQRQIKDSQAKLLLAFDLNIKNKQVELSALSDSIRILQGRYGIYDTEAQGELLSERYVQAESDITRNRARLEVLDKNPLIPADTIQYIKANLRAAERQLQQLSGGNREFGLKRFSEGISQVYVLKDVHFQARKQLSYDLERYSQIKSAYNANIPAVHLVEAAKDPLIKSRPARSIIILASVVGAFLFTLMAALIADAYRDVNWQSITQGDKQ